MTGVKIIFSYSVIFLYAAQVALELQPMKYPDVMVGELICTLLKTDLFILVSMNLVFVFMDFSMDLVGLRYFLKICTVH